MVIHLTVFTLLWMKKDGIAHHLGAIRAGMLLRQSEWAVERRDWNSATETALAALQRNPGNIRILRQLQRSLKSASSPESLATSRTLFDHPDATAEDRIEVVRFFLELGDHVTVANLISRLPAEERDSADAIEVGARFFLARNHPEKSLPLIDRLRRKRNEPGDLLLAAEALVRTPTEGDQALDEAQRIMGELFRGGDRELAFSALRLLRRIPLDKRYLYHFPEARERLETLARSGAVPLEAWFVADELDLAAHPDQREAILHGAIDRWLATEPKALGEWLVSLGEAKLFLENVPRKLTLEDPAMLVVVVQALVVEEHWDRALSLLEGAHRSVDPVTLFSLRAMIEERLGRVTDASQNWSRATRYAELGTGREDLLKLSRLAMLAGNTKLRDESLAEALKRPSPVSLAATDVAYLFPVLAKDQRDEDLLAISTNLLQSEPDNPQLLNNVVWLGLLRGKIDEEKMRRLEQHVAKFPSIASLRTTLALAQLRCGKTGEALETLAPVTDELQKPGKELPESGRAVLALALCQAGETEKARSLASSLNWSGLMKAEQDFFTAAFNEHEEDRFLLEEPVERY
jgi:hypothetical protein